MPLPFPHRLFYQTIQEQPVQQQSCNVFANLSEKIRLKIHTFRGSTSVFKGECYKHYVSSKVVIVLVLVAGFAFANFTENININYSLGADVAYAAYLNRLEGELTPEKEQFLEDEQKYFDHINQSKIQQQLRSSGTKF